MMMVQEVGSRSIGRAGVTLSGASKIQLVERWEGSCGRNRYRIDVERFEPTTGREFFNVKLFCDSRDYEKTPALSATVARSRVDHAIEWGRALGTTKYERTYHDASLAPRTARKEFALTSQGNRHELAAKIGLFLVERVGRSTGVWKGSLLAVEQRALFGRYLGKGQLIVDGMRQRVRHRVTRGFGMRSETTSDLAWNEL